MVTKLDVDTVGDSSLENRYWHMNGTGSNLNEAIQKSVEGQLQTQLGHEYEVVSHAIDGFTTQDVLNGGTIGAVFPWGGQKVNTYVKSKRTYAFGTYSSVHVKPLENLERSIKEKPQHAIRRVVISVGGNDFRKNLGSPFKLLTEVPQIQARYLQILERVIQLGDNVKPILMFQYRTDAKNDPYGIYTILGVAACLPLVVMSTIVAMGLAVAAAKISLIVGGTFIAIALISLYMLTKVVPLKVTWGILKFQSPGVTMIGALMEKFYKPIIERAKVNNIPILDLPNSFNPYQTLYISGIEPNEEAGRLIAQGLSKIIKEDHLNHSQFYRCDGSVSNSENWYVEYPKKV